MENIKGAIVTGGSRGIGKAICIKLAEEGYNIAFSYRSKDDEAAEVAKLCEEKGAKVYTQKFDVSDSSACNDFITKSHEFLGSIDVLVNNAGISEYKLFIDIDEKDLHRMLDVNILGTFNTTQSVLKKSMLPRKDGTIINISSIWGMVGASLEVAYSTSKAAIIGMSKSLAKELAPSNITVNVVAPGAISTDMLKELSDEDMKVLQEEIPLGKIGKVEDVAATVKFLASYEARYITGQVISPNGGLVI